MGQAGPRCGIQPTTESVLVTGERFASSPPIPGIPQGTEFT